MVTVVGWTIAGVNLTVGGRVFVQWHLGDVGSKHESLSVESLESNGDMTARDKRGDRWTISWDDAAEVWRVSQYFRDDWQVAYDVYVV